MVEDLFPDYSDHLEALLAADTIDDHIAVDSDEVLAVEYRILILDTVHVSQSRYSAKHGGK